MSKKLKLSQWHDGSVKPVHVGVYERKYLASEKVYCKWDGDFWLMGSTDIECAIYEDTISPFQDQRWRGIVK